MRRAARTDGNQQAIVDHLRARGCSVFVTSALGGGFPDLAVGYDGRTVLLEVKDPAQPLSRRRLTPQEQRFFDHWRGAAAVVETPEGAWEEVQHGTDDPGPR